MKVIQTKMIAVILSLALLPVGSLFACATNCTTTNAECMSDDELVLQQLFGEDEDRNAPYDTHNYPPA